MGNFCFDLGTPSFSIFCIILLQSKLHQIDFHTFFSGFCWTTIFSSSHQSPVPWLYVFGNKCLDVYSHKRLYTTISSILTITPTLYLRTSLETLSANLTPHIVLTICHSNPNNLNSSGTVSFQVSLQYKRTSLLVHFIMLLQREIMLANQTPPKSRPQLS